VIAAETRRADTGRTGPRRCQSTASQVLSDLRMVVPVGRVPGRSASVLCRICHVTRHFSFLILFRSVTLKINGSVPRCLVLQPHPSFHTTLRLVCLVLRCPLVSASPYSREAEPAPLPCSHLALPVVQLLQQAVGHVKGGLHPWRRPVVGRQGAVVLRRRAAPAAEAENSRGAARPAGGRPRALFLTPRSHGRPALAALLGEAFGLHERKR
jgi:hypothetical protein